MTFYIILFLLVSLLAVGIGVAILVLCVAWVKMSENVWTKSELEEKKIMAKTKQYKIKDFISKDSTGEVSSGVLHLAIPITSMDMTANDAYGDHTHNPLPHQVGNYEEVDGTQSEQEREGCTRTNIISTIENAAYNTVHQTSDSIIQYSELVGESFIETCRNSAYNV